ncbi:hypothetical protein [Massilia sp. BHUDP2]|uniref:hypothetical protein n=1 Tax=Massilia sp. BHUDP2 TaxID=3034505 RepID=UPI0039063BE3
MMRMFSSPARRGLVLILVLNATPTYESMFNSYRPTWTSLGRDIREQGSVTVIPKRHGFVFGVNNERSDVHFKERWHRLRFGYPVRPITIDYEQRKKQIQGRVEINWLLIWLCISCVLWMVLELMLFSIRALGSRLHKSNQD